MSDQEYRNVHMRMRASTVDRVGELQKTFKVETKTDAVRTAIDIARTVTNTIKNGGKVILVERDGSKAKLLIPGED